MRTFNTHILKWHLIQSIRLILVDHKLLLDNLASLCLLYIDKEVLLEWSKRNTDSKVILVKIATALITVPLCTHCFWWCDMWLVDLHPWLMNHCSQIFRTGLRLHVIFCVTSVWSTLCSGDWFPLFHISPRAVMQMNVLWFKLWPTNNGKQMEWNILYILLHFICMYNNKDLSSCYYCC